jgi:alpha-L-fucosidase 2
LAWGWVFVGCLGPRGGITLDLKWHNHQLVEAKIHSHLTQKLQLRVAQPLTRFVLTDAARGKPLEVTGEGNTGIFTAQGGSSYLLKINK